MARHLVLPTVALVSALLAFLPILHNGLHADDFIHFFDFAQRGLLIGALRPWGGHVTVVPQTVHYVWFRFFGADPAPYFALMLAVHVVNVGLLFSVLKRVTGSPILACLGATLWGTAPDHQGTLGWLAVFGHVLATTCILLVLRDVCGRRAGGAVVPARRVACWGLAVLVAANCHGVALPVALLFPAVVVLLVQPARIAPLGFIALAVPPVVALGEYAVFQTIVGSRIHDPFAGSLAPSKLWAHPADVLALWGGLLARGILASLLGWVTVLAAAPPALRVGLALAVGLLGLLGVRVLSRPDRRTAAGLLLVALAVYASIAAGRAAIYGVLGVSALLAAQHTERHHYLATVPLVVVAMLLLAQARWRAAPNWLGPVALAGWLALGAGLRLAWPPVIDHHDADARETAGALSEIRAGIAAAPAQTRVVLENRLFPPTMFLGFKMFPGLAGVFMIHFPTDDVDGRSVAFSADAAKVATAHRMGGRIARLFVPPEGAAP